MSVLLLKPNTKAKKTNPNIYIVGGDARYPKVAGYQILEGRSIGDYDVNQNSKVVVIGQEIKENLFGAQKAIGKTITLENGKFQVIGIFKEKQSIIPVQYFMRRCKRRRDSKSNSDVFKC